MHRFARIVALIVYCSSNINAPQRIQQRNDAAISKSRGIMYIPAEMQNNDLNQELLPSCQPYPQCLRLLRYVINESVTIYIVCGNDFSMVKSPNAQDDE